jgi:hypothetical protein
MSELKVETIKPAFGNKVTVSPGLLVTDSLQISKFEITTEGTVAIMGPLYVGTSVSKSAGTAGQTLISQGAGSPPTWEKGFPVGGIIMWSGTAELVPAGWAICDGENGTPDLRDRFVVGVGPTLGTTVQAIGGKADATIVAHTHTLTDPGHTHYFCTDDNLGGADPNNVGGNATATMGAGTGIKRLSKISGGGAANQGDLYLYQTNKIQTGITVNSPIGGLVADTGSNANLPPFMALYYIMKIS